MPWRRCWRGGSNLRSSVRGPRNDCGLGQAITSSPRNQVSKIGPPLLAAWVSPAKTDQAWRRIAATSPASRAASSLAWSAGKSNPLAMPVYGSPPACACTTPATSNVDTNANRRNQSPLLDVAARVLDDRLHALERRRAIEAVVDALVEGP